MIPIDVYGVCECGFYREAPFGDLGHVHLAVCPSCGRDKDTWSRVVGRVRNVGTFWRPVYRVVPLEGRDLP